MGRFGLTPVAHLACIVWGAIISCTSEHEQHKCWIAHAHFSDAHSHRTTLAGGHHSNCIWLPPQPPVGIVAKSPAVAPWAPCHHQAKAEGPMPCHPNALSSINTPLQSLPLWWAAMAWAATTPWGKCTPASGRRQHPAP